MRQARALTDTSVQFDSYAEQAPIRNSEALRLAEKSRTFVSKLDQYDQYGLRRTYHGFYYISHYYPLRAMDEISPERARLVIESLAGSASETYFHYPFCEQICTFCHFHKRVSSVAGLPPREREVLDMLLAELKLNRDIMGQPIQARSLQLGGGTPSLMGNANLKRFFESCEKNIILKSGAEVKTEIYPKRYVDEAAFREKLRILKSFGFTDLVIDLKVETIKP